MTGFGMFGINYRGFCWFGSGFLCFFLSVFLCGFLRFCCSFFFDYVFDLWPYHSRPLGALCCFP